MDGGYREKVERFLNRVPEFYTIKSAALTVRKNVADTYRRGFTRRNGFKTNLKYEL